MHLKTKIITLLLITLFISQLTLASPVVEQKYLKVPAGSESISKPFQFIEMEVDVIFHVDGSFKWDTPQGWSYVEKFIEGERRTTYYVEMSELHLISPNDLAVTFEIRMRVAPPETSAPFNPQWNEALDLPQDLKKLAKAFASTSETYFDYMFKVYDFVSNYIEYDISYLEKDPASIHDLWELRKGVCRHYTMLMKAFFDYAGIDSLYALGFLTYTSSGQPVVSVHMWIFVYDPANGWIMFDPTNNYYNNFTEHGFTYTYHLNLPVKITDEYTPYVYLPIYNINPNQIKEVYEIKEFNYEGTKITVQKLILNTEDKTTYFIRTIGAGNIFYIPVTLFRPDANASDDNGYVDLLEEYNFELVPEYVPEKYVVPVGSTTLSFNSFFKFLLPDSEEVEFSKYFNIQLDINDEKLIIEDKLSTGLKLFFTNDIGQLIEPEEENNKYYYDIEEIGHLDKLDLYLYLFGGLTPVASFNVNIEELQVTPIITIPVIGGFNSIIRIDTTPELGEKLKNYIMITGASIEEWIDDHTIRVIAEDETISISIGTNSKTINLYDTEIEIVSKHLEFKNSYTMLHLKYNTNVGELLTKYSLDPAYIRIGEKEYPISYTINKDEASITTPLTLDVLMGEDYTYYFITKQSIKDIINPKFTVQIENLIANYDGESVIITGWLNILPQNFDFDEQSLEDFSTFNIEEFSKVGATYKIKFANNPIPAVEFKSPYKITGSIFGKDITVMYTFQTSNLKIFKVRLIKYQAEPDSVKLYYAIQFSYSYANANEQMVYYMYSRMLNYVKINNDKYPAEYIPRDDYMIGYTSLPITLLNELKELKIFGVPVQRGVDYEVDDNYIEPKIIFNSLPLLGDMECNTPNTLTVVGDKFALVFDIESVYNQIQCTIGENTITLTPEVPYVFTINLIDTSRIDDIKDTSTIYEGYDSVYLVISTTTNMEFRIELDNELIDHLKEGSIKIPLPELKVGAHTISIYDPNNIEVFRKEIIVEEQPLSLKILHNLLIIIIVVVALLVIIIIKAMTQEDPLVAQAKLLFPNTEFLQKEQYGDWTYIYLMDELRGEVITVVFYQGRMANVSRQRLF